MRAISCLLGLMVILGSFRLDAAVAPAPSFRRGVSIAHWMAKVYDPAGPGAPWFGPGDIDWIAAHGFDHIRIAVDLRLLWRGDGGLDEELLGRLTRALHYIEQRGLGAVLDAHFLPGGRFDKDNQDEAIYRDPRARLEAAACWARLAERLHGEGDYLRFELINEPMAPSGADLNALNQALIAAIRRVDARRVLYVTCNRSSSFATLAEMTVPADPRVAILVHYDEPMVFTHQRASWKQCPADMPCVAFPGRVPDLRKLFPPDHFAYRASLSELTVAAIDADFRATGEWLRRHAAGHEVYLGEFGVFEMAPAQSQSNYVRAVSEAAARQGWGWCVWSYNGGMAIRAPDGSPTPVMAGLAPDR